MMTIKTLLVDDERSVLEQAEIFLKRIGEEIEIVAVSSPEKAFSVMEEKDFDVIVSDYQMPDKNGLEFLEELREKKDCDIPFIMCTGKGREEVAMKALNLGANRYLQKGGDPTSQYEALLDAIVQEYEHEESKRRLEESEAELKESDKNYKKILHETPLGVFHYDREGVITECNDKFVEITGSSREVLIGLDMLNDLDNDKLIDEVRSSLEEGNGYYEGEYTSVTEGKKRIARLFFKGIEDEGGEIDSGIALIEDITERKKAEEEIKYRENLERIITEISTSLMNIDVEEIEERIDQALEKIGEFSGADRSYIFQFYEDFEKMDNTHEWCAESVESQKDALQNISTDDFPWMMDKLKSFENVSIKKVSDMPPEAETEKKYFRNLNIGSLLLVPMISNNRLKGFIGYDGVGKKELSEEVINLLRIAGEVIASALGRKEVEKKLQESKERLDLALEGAELGVWDWNLKTDKVKFNERWAEMLGHSLDEIEPVIDSWEKRVHPHDLFKVKEELEKHLQGETDLYKTEHRMKTISDDWIWVKDVGKVVERDENGKPIRAVGIHENITDRKRSEQKLKEEREKYRAIFEGANDGIVIMQNKVIVDCNEKTLMMFGYDREEVIGEFVYEFLPDKQMSGSDLREMARRKINSALKGEPQEFEWIQTTKDGKSINVEGTLNGYTLDDEEYLIVVVRDITDRKEAEKRIEESKNKIERLDKIGAEIQTCDSQEEVYSLAIEGAEDILDFHICSFDAVEGDMFVTKIVSSGTPHDGYRERRIEESGLGRKTYLTQESYLVNDLHEDEDAKPVKSEYRSAISVPVGEKGVFQAVSTETDYFEEDDLNTAKLLISHVNEALDRIQVKEREEFLHSLLRHDVNNKNQIVMGYLELMKGYDLPDEVKDFLEKSEHAVKESSEIIEKTRKLRRIGQEEEISEVNLSSVLDKVLSKHQNQLEDKRIKLKIKDRDCKVKGGPLLVALFSNLINNSIQHSNCEKIKITSQTEEDECLVTVEDDGNGISDEIKEKIFDRGFKRGENAGTGLGLYMVKEIVKSYGGSVETKDSDTGGAKFVIHLKRAK